MADEGVTFICPMFPNHNIDYTHLEGIETSCQFTRTGKGYGIYHTDNEVEIEALDGNRHVQRSTEDAEEDIPEITEERLDQMSEQEARSLMVELSDKGHDAVEKVREWMTEKFGEKEGGEDE